MTRAAVCAGYEDILVYEMAGIGTAGETSYLLTLLPERKHDHAAVVTGHTASKPHAVDRKPLLVLASHDSCGRQDQTCQAVTHTLLHAKIGHVTGSSPMIRVASGDNLSSGEASSMRRSSAPALCSAASWRTECRSGGGVRRLVLGI